MWMGESFSACCSASIHLSLTTWPLENRNCVWFVLHSTPKHLAQCLAFYRYLVKMCWVNKWMTHSTCLQGSMWWEKQGLRSQEDPGHNCSATFQERFILCGRDVLKCVRKNNTSSKLSFKVLIRVHTGRWTHPRWCTQPRSLFFWLSVRPSWPLGSKSWEKSLLLSPGILLSLASHYLSK